MGEERCGTCRFWKWDGAPDEEGLEPIGDCRRYPPVGPVFVSFSEDDGRPPSFPLTVASVWCGEYQAKDGPTTAVLTQFVSDLGLSVRARKAVYRLANKKRGGGAGGLCTDATVGDLVTFTANELLDTKNCGMVSLIEIRQRLAQLGLALRDETPPASSP